MWKQSGHGLKVDSTLDDIWTEIGWVIVILFIYCYFHAMPNGTKFAMPKNLSSILWDYFEITSDNKSQCKLCPLKLSRTGGGPTTSLRKHLEHFRISESEKFSLHSAEKIEETPEEKEHQLQSQNLILLCCKLAFYEYTMMILVAIVGSLMVAPSQIHKLDENFTTYLLQLLLAGCCSLILTRKKGMLTINPEKRRKQLIARTFYPNSMDKTEWLNASTEGRLFWGRKNKCLDVQIQAIA
uniref:BED-type domain-containing protein n=1 Tax=Romanomermis culicivorax TaxID=13658 RepID=A0A915JTP5_ROMCU